VLILSELNDTSSVDFIARAGQVARAVLQRLGASTLAWSVLDIVRHDDPSPFRSGLQSGQSLLITIGSEVGDPESVGVYYSIELPEDQRIVATAEQIQEHAIEATHGEAIPPCPDHRHPLSARSFRGVASWVCPVDSRHHSESIMSR
jgi:hypothetical protein